MTIIKIFVKRGKNKGKQAGYFNTNDFTYYKEIKFKSSQLLYNPKYSGNILVSTDIIKQLLSLKCKSFKFLITGFEKHSYYISISIIDFLNNSKEFNWDDPQKGCLIKYWNRIPLNQEVLL